MQPAHFDDAPTRSALLTFLAAQLAESLAANTADRARAELSAWVAVLDLRTLAGCLRQTPERTADALTLAIRRRGAEIEPGEAIGDLIADTYPRQRHADRERLRLFTIAVQRLARDQDGTVTDKDLVSEGFGIAEQRRLMPMARELIAALEGRAVWRDGADAMPSGHRLREIGTRVAARQAPADAR